MCPSSPFAILELKNPPHDVPEQRKIRRSTDFEALNLCMDSSVTMSKIKRYFLLLCTNNDK